MIENVVAVVKSLMGEWFAYIWFLVLGIWGGTAAYIGRIRKTGSSFSLAELLGDWVISGLCGLLTAYFCAYLDFDFALIAVLCGISGHMGSRAIFAAERIVLNKLGEKAK